MKKTDKQKVVASVFVLIFMGSMLALYASDNGEEHTYGEYIYGIAPIDPAQFGLQDAVLHLCQNEDEYWLVFLAQDYDDTGNEVAVAYTDSHPVSATQVLRYNPESDTNLPHIELVVDETANAIVQYVIVLPEGYVIPSLEEYNTLLEAYESETGEEEQ